MKITIHTDREFADAIKALLPPGAAWKWPEGGFGDDMLLGAAQEMVRIDEAAQVVLDNAVSKHAPKVDNWHIDEYRRVAKEAIAGVSETKPRRPAAIGGHIGDRLWSHEAPAQDFDVDLVKIDHLFGPARIGSKIGDAMWGTRSRYIIRVRYYSSVVNPAVLWKALSEFKQSHVFLWFEDITGAGGFYHASN
ncbi:hypothetical protein [Herbaspirillum sp.]|uniref:hypothetical protein n=1 Tax=Herbaspirillum sp. TaxID=1890675 RepID=UPI001B17A264|nr:hypothetical protein [Herbaspirillum sp.]MBO9538772.1 hypothetical protein [Herbaspirillum sp.]